MFTPNLSKVVIILRGVSGASKSTFASLIKKYYDYANNISQAEICAADDYFINNNEYNFNSKKLGAAHKFCQDKFEKALKNNIGLVICANTNTKEQDIRFYIDKAKEYGYTVFSLVVENRHNNNNIHNVPVKTLNRQEENLRNSLKLI